MMRRRKTSGTHPTSFLLKTYEILADEAMNEIIAWNEDGTSFLIKNVTDFSETILPKYFKHSNFASFVRQLNMYDFHKCKNGEENSFYHPLFQKGRRHLLKEIHRKTSQYHNPPISRSLSRAETKALFERIKNMKAHQESMETNIERLEKMYADMSMKNQMLMSQLQQLREKEKRTEKMMIFQSNYMKSMNRGDVIFPSIDARRFINTWNTENSPKPFPFYPDSQSKQTGIFENIDSPVPYAHGGFPLNDPEYDLMK